MNMNYGVGEIRQTTAVVKVHMGQHDVPHVLRLVAEARDLAHGGLLRVHGHSRDDLEQACDARLVDVIILPKARIHEYKPLAGLDQQTQRPGVPCEGTRALQV